MIEKLLTTERARSAFWLGQIGSIAIAIFLKFIDWYFPEMHIGNVMIVSIWLVVWWWSIKHSAEVERNELEILRADDEPSKVNT